MAGLLRRFFGLTSNQSAIRRAELERDAAIASAIHVGQMVGLSDTEAAERLGRSVAAWMDKDVEPQRKRLAAMVLAKVAASQNGR
jgi:hypothetical protein